MLHTNTANIAGCDVAFIAIDKKQNIINDEILLKAKNQKTPVLIKEKITGKYFIYGDRDGYGEWQFTELKHLLADQEDALNGLNFTHTLQVVSKQQVNFSLINLFQQGHAATQVITTQIDTLSALQLYTRYALLFHGDDLSKNELFLVQVENELFRIFEQNTLSQESLGAHCKRMMGVLRDWERNHFYANQMDHFSDEDKNRCIILKNVFHNLLVKLWYMEMIDSYVNLRNKIDRSLLSSHLFSIEPIKKQRKKELEMKANKILKDIIARISVNDRIMLDLIQDHLDNFNKLQMLSPLATGLDAYYQAQHQQLKESTKAVAKEWGIDLIKKEFSNAHGKEAALKREWKALDASKEADELPFLHYKRCIEGAIQSLSQQRFDNHNQPYSDLKLIAQDSSKVVQFFMKSVAMVCQALGFKLPPALSNYAFTQTIERVEANLKKPTI